MNFLIKDNFIKYELGNIFRIFYPYEKLDIIDNGNCDLSVIINEQKAEFTTFGKTEIIDLPETQTEQEFIICQKFFRILSEINSYKPNWGMLTGIHPVKLFAHYERKLGTDKAKDYFMNEMEVSQEKTNFAKQILDIERAFLDSIAENDFSLYVSIPFCPSRCSYCSFVSQSIEKKEHLIPDYFEKLLIEIEHTAKVTKQNNLNLISVYIGGGTPTTLSAKQLKQLILKIRECFDFSFCREFTVEAGRVDTIDTKKLEVLKSLNIDRISINPQSLNDNVLKLIGRNHNSDEFLKKYSLAKSIGFNCINTDLIAGLQGDTFESFCESLEKIIKLSPENITIHSLALKRSAEIFWEKKTKDYHSDKNAAQKMIEYSIKRLGEEGYSPYYLYRQSRMAGNSENTGWCKKGFECAYNIYTMDESQTIIACGAGAVTKVKDFYSSNLKRIFNFKYSYEYLSRFDEIIKRKDEVSDIYEQFRKRLY